MFVSSDKENAAERRACDYLKSLLNEATFAALTSLQSDEIQGSLAEGTATLRVVSVYATFKESQQILSTLVALSLPLPYPILFRPSRTSLL